MKKRSLVLILSLLLVVSGFSGNVFAAEFPDMPVEGYWSTAALEKAVENGLLTGFEDGQIKPKANLERAQMAAVINRAFEAKEEANLDAYTDVKATDWFYPEMAKAVAMGTFKGDGDRLDPNDPITREQAFIVIARALDVEASVEQPEGFTDLAEVSTWANKEVYALVNGGYVEGSAGKLNPKGNISREEFAQLMHNIIADYNLEDGQEIDGNAMINKADTVLKDAIIKGDLVIGDGVAEGDVTLDNVTVEGRLLVRGGGANSILIKGKSNINSITTSKVKGTVRLAVEKEAKAGNLTVRGDDVIVEGKFKDINIVSENIEVNANKASAETVSVKGAKSKLVVGEESTVKKLVLEGKGTEADVSGKVASFVIDKTAEAPKVNVKKGGQVDKMEVNTEATIAGEGKVTEVKANANNIKVNTVGTKVSAAEGTSGVTAGDKEVEAGGEVETETPKEEVTPPSGGEIGGGGGSSGSGTLTKLTVEEVSAVNGKLTVTFEGDVTEVPEGLVVLKDTFEMELDASDFVVAEGKVEITVPVIEAPEEGITEVTYAVTLGETTKKVTFKVTAMTELEPTEEEKALQAAIAAINAGEATVANYTAANITGVNEDNLTDVNTAVAAAKEAAEKDLTKEEIQAEVDKVVAQAQAAAALDRAKEEAYQQLRDAGVTGQIFYDQIKNANTVEGVENLVAEILEAYNNSALDRAKEEAYQQLRDAGVTGQIFYDQIKNANTVEGVESLKEGILKGKAKASAQQAFEAQFEEAKAVELIIDGGASKPVINASYEDNKFVMEIVKDVPLLSTGTGLMKLLADNNVTHIEDNSVAGASQAEVAAALVTKFKEALKVEDLNEKTLTKLAGNEFKLKITAKVDDVSFEKEYTFSFVNKNEEE